MPNRLTPADADTDDQGQQEQPPLTALEVYDADEDDMVTRSPHQQRQAAQLMRMVEMATLVKAVALARVADRKHYLDLGHPSFKAFAEASLPVGYRSAQMYVKIGRKFAPMLPEFEGDETKRVSFLEEEIADSEEMSEVAQLPLRSLHKLTKLDDEHFEDVVREGKVVMPDGETEYSIEELTAMKTREASEVIEEAQMEARAYRARIQQLEEEKKRIEAEREADAEKIDEAEERLEEARALEARHGAAARTWSAREGALSEAAHHVREVRRLVVPLEMDETAEQGLANQLVELLRELHATTEAIKQSNAGAREVAEDTIEITDTAAFADDIIDEELGLGEEADQSPPEQSKQETGAAPDADDEARDLTDEARTENLDPGIGRRVGHANVHLTDEAHTEDIDPERIDALARAGWEIQRTTDGSHQMLNHRAGYKTLPDDSLFAVVDQAELIEERRTEGNVPPNYYLDE